MVKSCASLALALGLIAGSTGQAVRAAAPAPPAQLQSCAAQAGTAETGLVAHCRRTEVGDYRFATPADLPSAAGDVHAWLDRMIAELVVGLDMVASQDREDARAAGLTFDPWRVDMTWRIVGLNPHIASLLASTTLAPRPSRRPGQSSHAAVAMLVDRDTGTLVPEPASLFADNLGSARSTYCAHLDIQRVANALAADAAAGAEGKPPIIDGQGRYLGKWACPWFGELAIGFSGRPGEAFDHVVLIAAPEMAGPEREGYYRVVLPITVAMLDQVKPRYRLAFKAAAQ